MLLLMVMAMVMVYWTDHDADDAECKDNEIKMHGDDKIKIQFSRLVIGAGMLGKETQSDESQAQVGGKSFPEIWQKSVLYLYNTMGSLFSFLLLVLLWIFSGPIPHLSHDRRYAFSARPQWQG